MDGVTTIPIITTKIHNDISVNDGCMRNDRTRYTPQIA